MVRMPIPDRVADVPASVLSSAERDRIVLDHLPLVCSIAKRIRPRRPVSYADLCSAGMMGLLDALTRFEPGLNVEFRYYAPQRIRGAIFDSLRGMDWGTRTLRRHAREKDKLFYVLTARYGRTPSESEMAQGMGLDLARYRQLQVDLWTAELVRLPESLAVEEEEEENQATWEDVIATPEPDQLNVLLQAERQQWLKIAMSLLSKRCSTVLRLYYYEELSMKEIGLRIGVSESRVFQIHKYALRRLHELLVDFSPHAADKPKRVIPLTDRLKKKPPPLNTTIDRLRVQIYTLETALAAAYRALQAELLKKGYLPPMKPVRERGLPQGRFIPPCSSPYTRLGPRNGKTGATTQR